MNYFNELQDRIREIRTVEYELTEHSYTLHLVMAALKDWGKLDRNRIIRK